jgi:RecB family exonuclease
MSLHLTQVAYGPAALAELRATVDRLKGGDPLRPITIVVPTNAAGVAARRSLARHGGVVGVRFLTLYRLADLLGGPALAAAGRRPVSTPVVAAAIRSVLTVDPGSFAAVGTHPATIEALQRVHRDLGELDRAQVERIGRHGSPLAADVARVSDATRALLRDEWYDEPDLLRAAAQALTAAAVAQFGVVVLHSPQRVTPAATHLVQALAEHVDVEVLAAMTGDERADSGVVDLLRRLGVPPHARPAPPAAPSGAVVISTSDADEEVRAAVRRVVAAAHEGTPLDRIAVLWSSTGPYLRLLAEHLDAAGVPWNGPSQIQLTERVAGRTLIALLDLDRHGWRRHDVMAFISSSPIRGLDRRLAPTGAWERISRLAGVARGDDWDRALTRAATMSRAQAQDESISDAMQRYLLAEAERAESLREFVASLRASLGPRDQRRAWSEWAEWSHTELRRLLGGMAARERLPSVEQKAFERVEAALDRLGTLDAVAEPATRPDFRDALFAELEASFVRRGRIGEGVVVGPLSTAVGIDASEVIVLGACDGVLPRPPITDPLLDDADRAHGGPGVRLASDATDEQRRHFLAALAAAPALTILRPRGDLRRSSERPPSRWIAELVRPVEDEQVIASFAGGVEQAPRPSSPQDDRTQVLLRSSLSGRRLDDSALARRDGALRPALRLLRARESSALTAYDGDLSELTISSPFNSDRPIGVTRLEMWLACPHAYFMDQVLRVPIVDDPDVQLEIAPMERGSLVHRTLDRFLRRVLDGELEVPGPFTPWSPAHHDLANRVLEEEMAEAEAAGIVGRELLWQSERQVLRREITHVLRADDARRATSSLTPLSSEQPFDDRPRADGSSVGAWAPLRVELSRGRSVTFRGQVDRVDVGPDGRVAIVDYKGKRGHRYDGISALQPLGKVGERLQLPVYAAVAAHALECEPGGVRADYVFTREPAKSLGYQLTDEIWTTFLDALEVIADAFDAGLYPPRPEQPKWMPFVPCEYCDPDGLGTAARYREWVRKRNDPRLRSYAVLVGELADEEGGGDGDELLSTPTGGAR